MSAAGVDAATTIMLSLTAVVAAVAGWVRWARPRLSRAHRDLTGVRDVLLGREAVLDSITGEMISPPVEGIGQRMASTERQIEQIARTMTTLARTTGHLDRVDKRLADHEARIAALEETTGQ